MYWSSTPCDQALMLNTETYYTQASLRSLILHFNKNETKEACCSRKILNTFCNPALTHKALEGLENHRGIYQKFYSAWRFSHLEQ